MFPACEHDGLSIYNPPMKSGLTVGDEKDIVLFDGTCHLCLGSIRFLLRYDTGERYRLAWLQSPAAERLLSGYEMPSADSVVLLQNGQFFFRSTAILKALIGLGGIWKLAGVLFVVPVRVRDTLYDFVGTRRYRWFGQAAQCELPAPSTGDRFLADGMRSRQTS